MCCLMFTANSKWLLVVWGYPVAVITKIDFSIAFYFYTHLDGIKYFQMPTFQ